MSAWIVSKAHIDFLVAAARAFEVEVGHGMEMVSPEVNPDKFGKILWDENHRSVNYRYEENKETPEYHYDERFDGFDFKSLTGLGFLEKAVGCYNYQTCECSDYDETTAHVIVDELNCCINEATKKLVPELQAAYHAFPWGLDEFEQIEKAKKNMAEGKDCYGVPIA